MIDQDSPPPYEAIEPEPTALEAPHDAATQELALPYVIPSKCLMLDASLD